MTFLPIVDREIRVASRRRRTWWSRLGLAALGLAAGCWVMAFQELRRPNVIGMYLFIPIASIAFLYSFFGGVRSTADCVSEEKRDGTLGLLFLTDLKGYDVVLGKLAASSLQLIYGLLGLFPLLAIPLLAGGVSGAEFARVVVVALNTLFLSMAIGLFFSAICRDERRALSLSLLVLFVLAAGFPLVGGLIADAYNRSAPSPLFYLPSPGFTALMAFDEPFKTLSSPARFYWALVIQHLMAWAGLVAACLIVPRIWQDRPLSPAAQARRERFRRFEQGTAQEQTARRAHLLAESPFTWLILRDRMKGIAVWTLLGVIAIIWAAIAWRYRHDGNLEALHVMTALAVHTALKLWIATEAGRQFCGDRKSGAIELLLCTPLSVSEIIRGQLGALTRIFGSAVAMVVLVEMSFLFFVRSEGVWVWVVGILMLIADAISLSIVGMWRGLNNRSSHRATAETAVRLLGLPWILWAVAWTAVEFFSSQRNWTYTFSELHIPEISWLLVGMVVDAVFGISAWRNLHQRFRAIASEEYSRRRWWFGSRSSVSGTHRE